jgi:hypothetical protein
MASLNKWEIIGHLGSDPEMKECSSCHSLLPRDEFSKGKNSDGLRSACRACCSESQRKYYYLNGGKEMKDAYYILHREELLPKLRMNGGDTHYNPEKQPARIAVSRAVSSGKINRPNECEICHKQVKTEAHHHNGYNNRLDVMWLCPQCHKLEHHPEFKKRLMEVK